MQTSGSCLYSPPTSTLSTCAWDPRIKGLFFYETTTIFLASRFTDFIRDVKTLRFLKPDHFCGVDVYNGFLIHFIKDSRAYLGQTEDSVVVDFNYYQADEPSTPRLNQDVWEEVEQMAFFKYRAKPHWAKNRNLAFFGVQSKYPNFNKFLVAKKQMDPQNMFSSEMCYTHLYIATFLWLIRFMYPSLIRCSYSFLEKLLCFILMPKIWGVFWSFGQRRSHGKEW